MTTRFFCKAFPNLQPACGGERVEYMDPAHPAWALLRDRWSVRTVPEFLKHLFNKHDGEARLLGDASWVPLDEDVRQPAFWSAQFARTDPSRQWLANRRNPAELLSWEEAHWVLDQRDGETLLIRRVPSERLTIEEVIHKSWARPDPSVRGRTPRSVPPRRSYYIRAGRVVTLPEMIYYGVNKCTCYDMYKFYMDLPIFIHKRDPPGTLTRRRAQRARQ